MSHAIPEEQITIPVVEAIDGVRAAVLSCAAAEAARAQAMPMVRAVFMRRS
jgi:hypothetical protein